MSATGNGYSVEPMRGKLGSRANGSDRNCVTSRAASTDMTRVPACARRVAQPDEVAHHAVIGEGEIGANQLVQRGRQRADRQREAVIGGRSLGLVDAEQAQIEEGLVEADRLGEIGGGHVARIGERPARRHRAEEAAVGIGDGAGAERGVEQLGFRRDGAALQRQGIDEGLQRAARRALGQREVDGARCRSGNSRRNRPRPAPRRSATSTTMTAACSAPGLAPAVEIGAWCSSRHCAGCRGRWWWRRAGRSPSHPSRRSCAAD